MGRAGKILRRDRARDPHHRDRRRIGRCRRRRTTTAASDIGETTATLNATVAPAKEATTYYFEYGTTTAYGSRTPNAGPIGGNAT